MTRCQPARFFCEQLIQTMKGLNAPFLLWNQSFVLKCLRLHAALLWLPVQSHVSPSLQYTLYSKTTKKDLLVVGENLSQQRLCSALMQWHHCVLIWQAWSLTVWCQHERFSGDVLRSTLKVAEYVVTARDQVIHIFACVGSLLHSW